MLVSRLPSRLRFSDNPIAGIGYFVRGLGLITRRGIRGYVLIPLAVNVVLFAGLVVYGWVQAARIMDWASGWLPGWLDWLSWILVPLFLLASLLVVAFGFSLLANLIAAPFNGLLAAAVERELRGGAPGPEPRGLLAEVLVSIGSELRKLAYFLAWAVPILVLFLIPGLNAAAPFVWIAFSAWMLAIAFADYPMANHGIAFSGQRRRMAARRLTGLGFGAAVLFALLVPGLNLVVIPAAVAGATALWVEQLADLPHDAEGAEAAPGA